MRSLLLLTPLLAPFLLSTACRPHRPAAPTTRLATTAPVTAPTTSPSTQPARRPPAVFDLRRGTGSFPLGPDPIDSPASLAASLRHGYLAGLTPPDPDTFLTLTGDLPTLDLLRVDVSSARVLPTYRPAVFDKSNTIEQTLTARRLEYIADPLNYDKASASFRLVADDARLDLVRDAKGARGLVLAAARHGRLEFHTSIADFNKMLSIGPAAAGGSASRLTVLRSTVTFTADSPQTLRAHLDLRARYILLPITLALRARLTASPDGTLTFSDLSATGYDPGGLLAAAFLNPSLEKLDGTSQPLLLFPDLQTRITDVRFSTTNGLTLTIDFARQDSEGLSASP